MIEFSFFRLEEKDIIFIEFEVYYIILCRIFLVNNDGFCIFILLISKDRYKKEVSPRKICGEASFFFILFENDLCSLTLVYGVFSSLWIRFGGFVRESRLR